MVAIGAAEFLTHEGGKGALKALARLCHCPDHDGLSFKAGEESFDLFE